MHSSLAEGLQASSPGLPVSPTPPQVNDVLSSAPVRHKSPCIIFLSRSKTALVMAERANPEPTYVNQWSSLHFDKVAFPRLSQQGCLRSEQLVGQGMHKLHREAAIHFSKIFAFPLFPLKSKGNVRKKMSLPRTHRFSLH